MPNDSDADALRLSVARLRALGHAERLQIAAALSSSSMTVKELCSALSLSQTRASQHLAQLREAGIVTCVANGRWREYRVEPDAVAFTGGPEASTISVLL